MKRIDWIDSCRFLAMAVTLFVHFLQTFYPAALLFWEPGPTYWLSRGFQGKIVFVLYFVLLGFFACTPKPFSLSSFARYTLRRYLLFVFFSFLSTLAFILGGYVVTWIFHTPDPDVFRILSDGPQYNLIYLLRDAFYLEDHYIDSFWCMKDLFFASITCRLFGYLPDRVRPRMRALIACVLIAALMLINAKEHIWICVALMGCLLRLAMEQADNWEWLKKPRLRFLVVLFTIALLKIPDGEGPFLFFVQGVADSVWMLLISYNERIQHALSHAPMPRLGKLSMGIFVIHTPVYCLLRSSLFPIMLNDMPGVPAYLLCFALCISLSILGARILHWAYDSVSGARKRQTVSAR